MILAAGYGKRLAHSRITPRNLSFPSGKPMIVHHLEKLAEAGIREVVINLGTSVPKFLIFLEVDPPGEYPSSTPMKGPILLKRGEA